MIAPDTNVLVRLLVVDDPAQTTRACSMFEQGDILILKTVLLEAEWVLRSRYVLKRDHIAVFFRNLAETDGIGMEHEDACRAAVADKVGVLRTADEFLKHRAGRSSPQDLVRYLRAAPKAPPVDGDAVD